MATKIPSEIMVVKPTWSLICEGYRPIQLFILNKNKNNITLIFFLISNPVIRISPQLYFKKYLINK
jgi:hypothetical protein